MHQDISILGETLKLIHVSHLLYAAKDLTGYEDEHVKAHTINQDRLGKEYHFHASWIMYFYFLQHICRQN